ncbi:hypothetical protein ACN6AT_35865 (plasmid) [Streptomyces sp. JL4002]|uniref:hypothetical protein n=1 Tax=Streptomyces sp. JL4002 TaxID=3404781 RepID=UPI003B284962
MKHSNPLLDPLAENAVIAVCALADAAGPGQWSSGAVEDAATALEVLAGALSELSPEAAELLEVIPAAVAALRERVDHAPAAAVPAHRADAATDPAVLSTGLRRALAAHSLTGHRVHQLGPALLTVTLDAAPAQALAVLLAARRALPHQPPAIEDEPRWGAGPAETAAASLAVALAAYGPGTYARVLASGQVTAGLSSTAAAQVTGALNARPAPAAGPSRPRRRGLGNGWKGIDAGR